LDETPKRPRHGRHIGAIATTEGKYGEDHIHLAAGEDTTQKDPRQDVVDLEEKVDKTCEEKKDRGMEEKWYSGHNGTKPEMEHAMKQISPHSRTALWR